jgi:hypothetical protein
MSLTRRHRLAGIGATIAAPYVVRNSGLLMPVRDRLSTSWCAVIAPRVYPEPSTYDQLLRELNAEIAKAFNIRPAILGAVT